MNASEMNARQAKKTGGSLLIASGLMLQGGCVVLMDPATDPASPVAARVEALVDANRTWPRWADFPRSTGTMPAPVEVAARVGTLRQDGETLTGEAARLQWTMDDPAAFEAEVARRMEAGASAPIDVRTPAEIEAFAEQTRQRGAAPPPVDRTRPPR